MEGIDFRLHNDIRWNNMCNHNFNVLMGEFLQKQANACTHQTGRSPKVVALYSATNFSSYIIELLQLHDTIQIKWKYSPIHYIITIWSHLMI